MNTIARIGRSSVASQRRMVRIRATGIMDRMGPETPQVYTQYALHFLALGTVFVMSGRCVADFEVENPWEHFYAQIPRLPHFGTQMST